MATNPAVSLPDAGAVREALEQARTVRRVGERAVERHGRERRAYSPACRGLGREERHRHQFRAPHLAPAHLPAAAGRSKARLVDRQRRWRSAWALPTRSPTQSAADIFREHAALSAFENDGTRDFDIGALPTSDDAAFETLAPFQWPRATPDAAAETRFFADGGFFTPDRKAPLRRAGTAGTAIAQPSEAFPFMLNTGRIRDQWHTMTRTGLSPRLASHLAGALRRDPSRRRACRSGLRDGDFARVATRLRQPAC